MPEFSSDPSKPIKMRINEKIVYTLPVKENPLYKIEAIHNSIPQFASFKYPDYTLKPTKKTDVGKFQVIGKIGNSLFNIFKEFKFNIEVINDPPEFVGVEKELPEIAVS